MREVHFYGSDYVEHFWNAIDGEFIPDKVYQHPVTKEDAIDYATLREGMTVHMMAHRMPLVHSNEVYLVHEAVSEDIDDSALNAKVADLLAAGALLVDNGDGRHSIVVRTYEELVESWGTPKELVDDPKWDELERISQRYYHQKYMRELNKYFVANSRVFTADELEVIANYKKAEAAYYELFPRPERKK
jgi:hypothetical protein